MPESMESATACHKVIKNHVVLAISLLFFLNYQIIKRSLNNFCIKKDSKPT